MTLVEFVGWLASAAALGVVSSFVVDALKEFAPGVQDKSAVIASIVFAAVASVAATLLEPYLGELPVEVEQFWPVIVWAAQQLWYQLIARDHSM